ncbi:hypothetical protein L0337_32740 [candidate division KSB1 bacterium]|nr:hypothetical protein [candidate division KSB1 bacterium]
MAKYQINFSCGHDEQRELFGATKERQRKIEYFEQYGDCSACFKKRKESEREAEGPVVQVRARKGDPALIEFVVFNSFSVKDALKARGYRFSYDFVRVGSAFGLNDRGEGAWGRRFEGGPETISEQVADEIKWLKSKDWKFEDATSSVKSLISALIEGKADYIPAS